MDVDYWVQEIRPQFPDESAKTYHAVERKPKGKCPYWQIVIEVDDMPVGRFTKASLGRMTQGIAEKVAAILNDDEPPAPKKKSSRKGVGR